MVKERIDHVVVGDHRGVDPSVVRARRVQSRWAVLESWSRWLVDPSAGRRTVEAILPALVDWVNRDRGRLTFRLRQMLTGHGCLGEFLYRIEAEPRAECHHCGCDLTHEIELHYGHKTIYTHFSY